MDKVIAQYNAVSDHDLMLCLEDGVAYQTRMHKPKRYDNNYFGYCQKKYGRRKKRNIEINKARIDFVYQNYGPWKLLDIGIGDGSFISHYNALPHFKKENIAWGYDIDETARKWLIEKELLAERLSDFECYTMWDVLEHLSMPFEYFRHMGRGDKLFLSIPIVKDLKKIRESKHYRPGEHLYYFTEQGLIKYMSEYGFDLIAKDDFEIKLGRIDIYNYCFERNILDYHDILSQYQELHNTEHYGSSSTDYLEYILPVVKKLSPRSILDYGCGRSDLVCYFYRDGDREVYKYDPAIVKYKTLPVKRVSLVLCMDVLEHIMLADLDVILKQIKQLSDKVIFSVSCIPARKKLPNGRNAHVNVRKWQWWAKRIQQYFGKCVKIWLHPEEKVYLCKTF